MENQRDRFFVTSKGKYVKLVEERDGKLILINNTTDPSQNSNGTMELELGTNQAYEVDVNSTYLNGKIKVKCTVGTFETAHFFYRPLNGNNSNFTDIVKKIFKTRVKKKTQMDLEIPEMVLTIHDFSAIQKSDN